MTVLKALKHQVKRRLALRAEPDPILIDLASASGALVYPCSVLRNPTAPNDGSLYYVIWREGGGLFSILASVLGHLRLAMALGAVPVVDMQNFPSVYRENEPVHGSMNVWDYYFEPVSTCTLNQVYESANVLVSDGSYPAGTTMSVSSDPSLLDIFDSRIRINERTQVALTSRRNAVKVGQRTLGIHFRGQEMRTAVSHPFPPTLPQVMTRARRLLASGEFDQIFLVTEGREYAEVFSREFGELVVYADNYRAHRSNAYREYPRPQHKYLLGLEVLTDMLLLSECGGLISGSSNVSEMAILLSRGRYRVNIQIRNGTNSANRILASQLWNAKSRLPPKFGGFLP